MPSPAALFASLVFGVIGFAAFMYGKKHAVMVPMVLGIGLMVFPYFVPDAWMIWLVGGLLTAAIWYFRE
jgi:hypothetical protein